MAPLDFLDEEEEQEIPTCVLVVGSASMFLDLASRMRQEGLEVAVADWYSSDIGSDSDTARSARIETGSPPELLFDFLERAMDVAAKKGRKWDWVLFDATGVACPDDMHYEDRLEFKHDAVARASETVVLWDTATVASFGKELVLPAHLAEEVALATGVILSGRDTLSDTQKADIHKSIRANSTSVRVAWLEDGSMALPEPDSPFVLSPPEVLGCGLDTALLFQQLERFKVQPPRRSSKRSSSC